MNRFHALCLAGCLECFLLGGSILRAAPARAVKRETPVHQSLLAGRAVKFDDDAAEAARTVPAAWVREAILRGMPVNLNGAILDGPLDLYGITAQAPVSLTDCKLSDRADLKRSSFQRGLNFSGTTFVGEVAFSDATVGEYLGLVSTRFDNSADFDGLKVKGGLLLQAAIFAEKVAATFTALECQVLNATGATFGGKVDFDRSHVLEQTFLGGVNFQAPVSFQGARFDGWAFLDSYQNGDKDYATYFKTTATFDDARFASGLQCQGVQFDGDVTFNRVDFGPSATFASAVLDVPWATHFEASFSCLDAQGGSLDLAGAQFRGGADFRNAHFRGRLSCHNYGLRDDEVTFAAGASFDDLQVGGKADFTGVYFMQNVSFQRVRFGGRANFGGDEVSSDVISACFLGGADFGSARFDGPALFSGVVFGREASFAGARWEQDASFGPDEARGLDAARFLGKSYFDSARVSGGAYFAAVTFEADASFSNAEVIGYVNFEGAPNQGVGPAKFDASAFFHNARLGQAGFRGISFAGEADFQGVTFQRPAMFHQANGLSYGAAKFLGPADFSSASFLADGFFTGVQFAKGADFSFSDFARNLFFEGGGEKEPPAGAFAGFANFSGVHFAGLANFRGVRFDGETFFSYASFLADGFFTGVQFAKGADFSFSDFARHLFFQGGGEQEPPAAAFAGFANFSGVHFAGLANFRGVRFDGETYFFAARWDGVARFQDTRFGADTDFSNVRVAGVLDLGGAEFRRSVDLRDAVLRAVQLQSDEQSERQTPQGGEQKRRQTPDARFDGPVDLRGCVYEHLRGSHESLLGRIAPFDLQSFTRLEARLRSAGDADAANEVYLTSQRQKDDADWNRGGVGNRIGVLLHRWGYGWFLNYGMWPPWPLLVFSAALLGWCSRQLAKDGWVWRRDPRNPNAAGEPVKLSFGQAFCLCLRLFLPVPVPFALQWQPAQEEAGRFSPPRSAPVHRAAICGAVLTLFGWLLVPLALAVLGGVLRVTR